MLEGTIANNFIQRSNCPTPWRSPSLLTQVSGAAVCGPTGNQRLRQRQMRFFQDQGRRLVTAELRSFHSKSSLSSPMEENSGVSAKSLRKNLNGFTALFLMKTLTLPIETPGLTRMSRWHGVATGGQVTLFNCPWRVAALTCQIHSRGVSLSFQAQEDTSTSAAVG